MHPADLDDLWYMDHVVLAQANTESAAQTQWRLIADAVRADPRVGELAAGQGFVMTREQARSCAVSDADVRRRVRAQRWGTPRHGVVSVVPMGEGTDDALRACAAVLVRRDHVISHRSAAVLHDLPLVSMPGLAPLTVELTHADSSDNRVDGSLHVRTARLPDMDVSRWFGVPVTTPARTVVDLARMHGAQGLVAADAALRWGRVTADELARAVEDATARPGIVRARTVLVIASGQSESPLESITRLVLADASIPLPQLQEWITDPADGWRARVDMLWRRARLVLEADGKLKYTRDELWQEKLRQERLERLGYRVVRVRWADVVFSPRTVVHRVADALRLK